MNKKRYAFILLLTLILSGMLLVDVNAQTNQCTAPVIDSDNCHNGHSYVDLGLPSGTKWATCNVGASSPEEDGDHFAWGETKPKRSTDFNWSTYKWCNGSFEYITKYCFNSEYGVVDNKVTLDPEDDAARVNWGGDWHTPSLIQMDELLENCIWAWTTMNSVDGYRVTGVNGNSIFLPITFHHTSVHDAADHGDYWTSSLDTTTINCHYIFGLTFYSHEVYRRCMGYRIYGQCVRPVLGSDPTPEVKKTPLALSQGTYYSGHYSVDLGLPSGTKWATSNVGATSPEEYGDYFAWGETKPKTTYDWSTYKWCKGSFNTMTKYCTSSEYGTVDNKITLDFADDAARVNWGGDWRMPTDKELEELRVNCFWKMTTQNTVNGYLVTGTNGNSIFLPAAGERNEQTLDSAGDFGYFWSSSLFADYPFEARYVSCCLSGVRRDGYDRYNGRSVRPVVSVQN